MPTHSTGNTYTTRLSESDVLHEIMENRKGNALPTKYNHYYPHLEWISFKCHNSFSYICLYVWLDARDSCKIKTI